MTAFRFSYPVFLDLLKKPCLVIGGGKVAERKAASLLEAGAFVTVISPRITKGLRRELKGRLRHEARAYKKGDIAKQRPRYALVIVASSSASVNRSASKEAEDAAIPVNAVDKPSLCSFIVPAVVRRGPLSIAISTSGKSPYLAKAFRKAFEETIPEELGKFTELLGAVRSNLLKIGAKNDKKYRLYAEFLDSGLLRRIRDGSEAGADAILRRLLGPGHTMKKLGIDIGAGKKKKR